MKVLLEEIAAKHRRNDYIAPSDDAAKMIEAAIQQKYHLTPACLGMEETTGGAKRVPSVFVTALPNKFVEDAQAKIEGLIAHLLLHKAKRFEIVFANRVADGNLWGDQVLLAARFSEE